MFGVQDSLKLALRTLDADEATSNCLQTLSDLLVAAWYSYSTPSAQVDTLLHTRSDCQVGAALSYSVPPAMSQTVKGRQIRPDVRDGGATWYSDRALHFLFRRPHPRSEVAVGATDSSNPRDGSQTVVAEHALSLVAVRGSDSYVAGGEHSVPSKLAQPPLPLFAETSKYCEHTLQNPHPFEAARKHHGRGLGSLGVPVSGRRQWLLAISAGVGGFHAGLNG